MPKLSRTQTVLLAFLAVGIFVIGLAYTADQFSIKRVVISETETLVLKESDQVKGEANAPVTIIEYSDFQCPACAAYQPILKQLLADPDSGIRFAYRHFPLSNIHRNAELAARAAEAAGKQGKFWEMHDTLFENQKSWAEASSARSVFAEYANKIGLDISKFESDLDSVEVKEKVYTDAESGNALTVRGTPTFFVNGTKIKNPQSYEEFVSIIKNSK